MAQARMVISASPLVKVYLEEWHDRLLEEPNLIYDDKEAFSFQVPHGTSSLVLDFNKPLMIKAREESDIETIYQWLIGELAHSRHETDCYGIVPFDPGIDMVGVMDQLAFFDTLAQGDSKEAEKARKESLALHKDASAKIQATRSKNAKESEARIKRAMKTVHNNLIRQWRINEENKQGKYPPTIAETLGAMALDKEIKAKQARGNKLYSHMNDLMNNVVTPG